MSQSNRKYKVYDRNRRTVLFVIPPVEIMHSESNRKYKEYDRNRRTVLFVIPPVEIMHSDWIIAMVYFLMSPSK